MNVFSTVPTRLRRIVQSQWFFRATLIFFVLQALWIALSSHYPMAFDEDFHMGIIHLYAHHLSPFWSAHPAGADAYGAITRDPSYLFQWLMSFPYRLLSLCTSNEAARVIGLRLINIALFAASLPLYRRVLLRLRASRAVTNACLFIFILLPVVPMLAAQVNYDNLLVPLVAALLLLTLRIKERLNHELIPLTDIGLLIGIGMLTSLVKYAALPLVVAMVGYLAIVALRVHSRRRTFRQAIAAGWRAMQAGTRWALLVLLLVSSVLFVERYGINTLKYHTPIPDCDDVLTITQCSSYGPWIRDYQYNLSKDQTQTTTLKTPIGYTGDWFWGMWFRTFFAVSGPNDSYQTRRPLPVPAIGAIVVAALAVVGVAVKGRTIWRRYDAGVLWLITAVVVLYVGSLWLTEYKGYLYTGQPVAINGRYLVPIAPLLFGVGAVGIYELLRKVRPALALTGLAIMLSFAWGGGAWTYIVRSSDNWDWQNRAVLDANHAAQHVLWPITPGAGSS
jgi:hypothetical protein